MKRIVFIAAVLPLALAAGACTRDHVNRIAAPAPDEGELKILEAHFVVDRDALAQMASTVAQHPRCREALASLGNYSLSATPQYTLREVATLEGGGTFEFTTLPYIVNGDPSHAAAVTLGSIRGEQSIAVGELIVGRVPKWDEPGFVPVSYQGQIIWVKDGDVFALTGDGIVARAPERFRPRRMLQCMMETSAGMCANGAAVGSAIAPSLFPASASVGCAVGVTISIGLCVAYAMQK